MTPDRREYARQRLAFPVLIESPLGMRRCIARDVSARGVFIETYEKFPIGSRLRVVFALPDGSWEMAVDCQVRRVVRLDASDGMLHGVGLQFDRVESDAAELGHVSGRAHA